MMARRDGADNGLLTRFARTRLLVVGDLMLDEFIWGKVSRISPEAPVPVVWIQSESLIPGGSANVANNIRALGGQVVVAGVIGKDRWGDLLMQELVKRRINTDGILRTARSTTVKTRVIAHHQQVVRVDREHQHPLAPKVIEQLIHTVCEQMTNVDGVVIEDYGKGTINRTLLEAVIPEARRQKKLIVVDPKEEHFDLYRGVTALTPNRAEAGEAVGRTLETPMEVDRAGKALVRELHCEALLITLGEDGMQLFERSGRSTRIPTVAREVYDVAGAGDTVIGTFTLALASGASPVEAAKIANRAAGIVVGKVGTGVVTPQELRAGLSSSARNTAARPAGSARSRRMAARTRRQPRTSR